MPRIIDWTAALIRFPAGGAFRIHRAPTQLSPRDTNIAVDRFDDPEGDYRVRYLATTVKGALLEVLDHLRPNASTEETLSAIGTVPEIPINILDQEPPGSVTEGWLSRQRLAHASIDHEEPPVVDVTNADLLARLNDSARIQQVLSTDLVRTALGASARLDQGTIRLAGPVGRAITQAVSREVYEAPIKPVGLSYISRFSEDERCWAVFDDRIYVQFDLPEPLSNTDPNFLRELGQVASQYDLQLPPAWNLEFGTGQAVQT